MASHRYARPGTYRARLDVDDGVGTGCSTATATRLVRVNAPPIAEAGPPIEASLLDGMAEITLEGGASRDPEGRPLRFLWSLPGEPAREGRRVTLRFDRPGSFAVQLHVSDQTGLPCSIDADAIQLIVRWSQFFSFAK